MEIPDFYQTNVYKFDLYQVLKLKKWMGEYIYEVPKLRYFLHIAIVEIERGFRDIRTYSIHWSRGGNHVFKIEYFYYYISQ